MNRKASKEAIAEGCRLANEVASDDGWNPDYYGKPYCAAFTALCDLRQRAHDAAKSGNFSEFILKEPVDPLVLAAREIRARWEELRGNFALADAIRNGEYDHTPAITEAVAFMRSLGLRGPGE